MTAKDLLFDISKLRSKIDKLDSLIEFYKQKAGSIGGQDFSREYIDCTRSLEAPFVKWIYKKIECEDKQKALQSEFDSKVNTINPFLERLSRDEYKLIAKLRYLDGVEWNDTAANLSFALSSIYRMNREMLSQLEMMVVNDSN